MGKKDKKFLDEFKRELRKGMVPTGEKELLSRFIDWCKEREVSLKRQTLGGANYKKFLNELERNFKKACVQADALIHLLKRESPLPISFETSWECFSGDAWNNCIVAAIKSGKIPEEDKSKSKYPAEQSFKEGWNNARKKLMNKELTHLFQG